MKLRVPLLCALLCCAVLPGDAQLKSNTAASWNSAAVQGIRDSKLGAPMVEGAGCRPYLYIRRVGGVRLEWLLSST
jgi:hypothetical protein